MCGRSSRAPLVLVFSAQAWACEMPESRYVDVLTRADSAMTVKQHRLERDFHMGEYQHYDYDEGIGLLILSDSGVVRVLADVQFVGDVSRRDSTWRWAWDLPYVPDSLARAASIARRYGWLRGVRRLRRSGWHGDQIDGWEMTSLTAWLAGADGAYRAPSSDSTTYTFMLLRHVRWAPPGRRASSYLVSPRRSTACSAEISTRCRSPATP